MKLKKIIMLLILALAWSIPACADEVKDNSDSTREWLNEKEDNGSQPKEETLTTEDQKDAEPI